jgi:type I restriction enzyme, S subunit
MNDGWRTLRIGDVCEIIKGRKPALKEAPSNGDLPYLVAKVMRGTEEPRYASVEDPNAVTVSESETIIICDGSNSGEVFTGFRGVLSSTMGKISKKMEINDRYLQAVLASTFSVLNAGKTGAAIPHLDKDAMYAHEFSCPPLPEQARIVGVLDKAFAAIATAKANTEKNLQNVDRLFASQLQAIFAKDRTRWIQNDKTLVDLCELIVDCEHKTAPTQEEGFPSIRTANIGRGKLILEGIYRVSQRTYAEWTRRAVPTAGDVVLAREAPAGNVAVIPDDLTACLGQRTVLIRIRPEVFDPEFLVWYLLQPEMQQKLLVHSRGATVQHVNMRDIRALKPDLIPPVTVQRSIVMSIKDISVANDKLRQTYEHKLRLITELKKSLLHYAFTGKLPEAMTHSSELAAIK